MFWKLVASFMFVPRQAVVARPIHMTLSAPAIWAADEPLKLSAIYRLAL
jgi:hypothetical protein